MISRRVAPAVHSTPLPLPAQGHRPWVRRAVIFVSCALLLDAVFGDRGVAELWRARLDSQRASDALVQLKQENAGLRDEVRRLREDSAAIESVAREDLGLIRPGEIVVRVKDVK